MDAIMKRGISERPKPNEDYPKETESILMGAEWITAGVLKKVMAEARRKGAAVFLIDDFTKGDKFRSLVFTMLSARTKDKKTLEVCRRLFSRISGPDELAKLDEEGIAALIYGVGFHNAKARNLKGMARMVCQEYGGMVPDDFEKLIRLPGVGRKTANVVLAHGFGKPAIGVDVHVHRIANRIGLVRTKKPEHTEERLKKLIEKGLWSKVNIALVSHGQTTCLPRNPKCPQCVIRKRCRRIGVRKPR